MPYLRVANVQDGFVDLTDISEIQISRSSLKRFAVLPNDVLMNEGGDLDKLGRGALWRGQIDPCVHQNHVFVVRCGPEVLPMFLNAWTGSPVARRYFQFAGKQTTNLASINKTSLGRLPVPAPVAKLEQQAIAEALDNADALIESVGHLLTKKRQIKQGAMQELLTGQRRLPGFEQQWDVARLCELADTDTESLGPETPANYQFRYIALEHVDQGRLCGHSEEAFGTAPSRARRKLLRGDILFSTVRPMLLSHLLFDQTGDDWVCSTGFCVIRCKQGIAAEQFIYALLFSRLVGRQVEALLTGSNYPAVNSRDVRSLKVPVPPLEEQTAIATTLSDMDAEITALEARLAKARALKQGMAQALLTGRIRLV